MIGLDWTLVIVAIVIIVIQTARGTKEMDIPLFEMGAFIIATAVAVKRYSLIANILSLSHPLALVLIFIIIVIILLYLAKVVSSRLELTWEPFDAYLSFIFGIVTAWSILYFVLRLLLLSSQPGVPSKIPLIGNQISLYESIQKSTVATEILEFKTFKSIGNFFDNLRLGKE